MMKRSALPLSCCRRSSYSVERDSLKKVMFGLYNPGGVVGTPLSDEWSESPSYSCLLRFLLFLVDFVLLFVFAED